MGFPWHVSSLRSAAPWLMASALAILILGAKFDLIRTQGSDVPFWDQWDAEGADLLIPWQEGDLSWRHFVKSHNEHRIVFTRGLNFALTALNGQWDARLEATVNALVHLACALVFFWLARRLCRGVGFFLAAGVIAAAFTLPFAWENTLHGFQSQVYFMLLLGLGHLALTLSKPAYSAGWWAGHAAGFAGLFAMSGGVLAAPASAAMVLLRARLARRWQPGDREHLLLSALATLVGFALLRAVPAHEAMKAASLGEFLYALLNVLSWPANFNGALALLVLAPGLILLLGVIRARQLTLGETLLLGLATWTGLQALRVAYAHSQGSWGNSPRFYDLYASGVIVQALTLGYLLRRAPAGGRHWLAALAWAGLLATGFTHQTQLAERVLHDRPAAKEREREHLRAYLHTGDPAHLYQVSAGELPYPRAERLQELLDHPSLRRLLPVGLRPAVPLAPDPALTRHFTPGFPPHLEPLSAATTWYGAGPDTRFASLPLPHGLLPVLRFRVAAPADSPVSALALVGADGRRVVPEWAGAAGDRWQTTHLFLPPEPVRLEAHAPAAWLAFAEPVEMGLLSWGNHHLLKLSPPIRWLGLALCGLTALVMVRSGSFQPWPDAPRDREPPPLFTSRLFQPLATGKTLVLAALGAAFLLFLRKSDALLNPQLWAEDGTIFLLQAEALGWRALFEPYAGYLHLFLRFIAAAGAAVDPCWIPAFYSGCAFLTFVAVAVRCLSPRLEVPGKPWLALTAVLVPSAGEVFLNLTNVQWITALLLVQQLLMRPARTRGEYAGDVAILAIVSLTGPFSLLLLPAFVFRAWHQRERGAIVALATVAFGALIQGLLLVQTTTDSISQPFSVLGAITVACRRLVGLQLTGPQPVAWMTPAVALALGFLAVLYVGYSLSRGPYLVEKRLLAYVMVVLLAAGIYKSQLSLYPFDDLVSGDRYFFLPSIMLLWILLLEGWAGAKRGRLAQGLLGAILLLNLPHVGFPPAIDYQWHRYCHHLRKGEAADIPTLPNGWILHYPGRVPPAASSAP